MEYATHGVNVVGGSGGGADPVVNRLINVVGGLGEERILW